MSRWMPADTDEARRITNTVLRRVAGAAEFTPSDAEEIADAWGDYASARYHDGAANERETNPCT